MLQNILTGKKSAYHRSLPSSAQMPPQTSGIYLAGSILSVATAMVFKHLGRKHPAFYLGEWIAPLLLMKVFSKWAQSSSAKAKK